MKINGTPNNSFQNKVLLDTFVEQISALQEDVAQLQDADRVLDNKISQQLSEEEFNDFQADAHVSNLHAAELNADTGFIGHLNSTQADVENLEVNTHAEIQDLTALTANIPSLTTDDVTVQGNITSAGNITAKDAELENVSADKVKTPLVEADLVKADVIAEDVETDTVTVKDKLTVKDVEVSGTVTGLSEINADSVNANEAEIETLNTKHIRDWISQVMNQEEALLPTPQLGTIDRYTIELPKFNGVYLLSWEDQNIVWSATVIGNGKSYGISWSSRTDENFITDLFQYNGKLYIRVNSNGRLKFAYSATKELPQPVIYFNMAGWTSDKSLEELCDEKSHLINAYPTGMIWFGKVFIPKLETEEGDIGGTGINFKGSCTLAQLPLFADTEVGDVWNITEETYTDNRFVEGAGKPINAGDDVVAVEADMPVEYVDLDGIEWTRRNSEVTFISSTGRLFWFNLNVHSYSDDGGETWTTVDLGVQVLYHYDMFESSNGTLLFSASTSRNNPIGYVFRSTDNGTTWTYTEAEWAKTKIEFFEDSQHNIWISPRSYRVAGYQIYPNVRISTDDGATFNIPANLNITGVFYFCETDTGRLFITGNYHHFVVGIGQRDTFGMFYSDDFENFTRCQYPSGKIDPSMLDNVSSPGVFRLYEFNGRLFTANPITDNIEDFEACMYYSDDNGNTWNKTICSNNMIISSYMQNQNFQCSGEVVRLANRLFTYSSTLYVYEYKTRLAYSDDFGASWTAIGDEPTISDTYISGLFVGSDNKRLFVLGNKVRYSDDNGITLEDTNIVIPGGNNFDGFSNPENITMLEKDKVLYFRNYYSLPDVRYDIVHTMAWDKFSAGVNYENFDATNITASTALKSEGTLEVDGTSQFNDDITVNADLNADKVITPDLEVTGAMTANSTGIALTKNVTHTGNYTQTGNQNITGNETVSGSSTLNNVTANTVIIGDLD